MTVVKNYYLISSLPPLGELGTPPPLGLREFLDRLNEDRGWRALIEQLLLGDDLLQRQAFLSGEVREVSPSVLTAAQARNEAPLPEGLAAPEEPAGAGIEADRVWAAYFRQTVAVARRLRSAFLAEWVGFEVGLRNALADARASALGLEPLRYLVTPELGSPDLNLEPLLAEWAAAPNPLAAFRTLDRARWDWLRDREAWFSFGDQELAAYAAKLLLLHRWHRLAAEPDSSRKETERGIPS